MQYELVSPAKLIHGEGQWVFVTGWLPPEVAARRWPGKYWVIGPLYSPRGVDGLIRNLLANARARNLVLIEETREDLVAGSMKSLREWLAGDDSIIGEDIPREALNQLRNELQVIEAGQEFPPTVKGTFLGKYFPIQTPMPEIDTPSTGIVIRGRTIPETWKKAVKCIRRIGVPTTNSDGVEWQEILALTLFVENGTESWDEEYPFNRKYLEQYLQSFFRVEPNHSYSYGARLGEAQNFEVTSTRNWFPVWQAGDEAMSAPPCLVGVWARVFNKTLHIWGVFRSNEVYSAWPANVAGLVEFQKMLCRRHGLKLGSVSTSGGSAHIRRDNWEAADRLSEPKLSDPVGNFIVHADRVEHESGWFVRGTARKMMREIAQRFPHMEVSHALYLGNQIERVKRGARQQ